MSEPRENESAEARIVSAEAEAIRRRRAAWGMATEPVPAIGLALSGGGIRSATFSLGVLRELSALKMLHKIDYLSTVSGGTFIGGFFGGLFVPRARGADTHDDRAAVITASPNDTDPLGSPEGKAAIALLRQSGRYLAPTGTIDYWYALALLTRNWIGLHLVIGSTIFLIALLGVWARTISVHLGWPGLPLGPLVIGPVGYLPVVPLALFLAYGWCYWLTRRDVGSVGGRATIARLGSILLVASCIGLRFLFPGEFGFPSVAVVGLGALIFIFIGSRQVAAANARSPFGEGPSAAAEEAWDRQRVILTRRQAQCLEGAIACGAFAVIDAAAFYIAHYALLRHIAAPSAIAAFLVPIARTLFARRAAIQSAVEGTYRQLFAKLAVLLAALLLLGITIGTWAVLAYGATWPFPADGGLGDAVGPGPLAAPGAWYALVTASVVVAIVVVAIRGTVTFLNLSALSTFYAGRLRRAYLGAGNRARIDGETGVERDEPGDEVQLIDYYSTTSPGAPVHLINLTLNQTTGGGTNIVQRDRHGSNMVIGPGGISRDCQQRKCRLTVSFTDEKVERLPLSTWIGISGAAFSTGLGARSGFGLSTLAGLANVRLGYWWRAGSEKRDRSVQSYLARELLGIFPGTDDRRWYLSDGGHFENTGVYELIRRQVPLVIACDNGQDEAYAFEDVANLVRKARIDFGAEINFLDVEGLDGALGRFSTVRRAFGTLAQIGGLEPVQPSAVAALARVIYGSGAPGTLVLIKPRLTGDGPADLLRYKAENSAFPQQSTLNQFFDEAQWESYYTLGRHITQLVMKPTDGRWSPGSLTPLP